MRFAETTENTQCAGPRGPCGLNARRGVLDHQTFVGRQTQKTGGQQKQIRIGLAPCNLGAVDTYVEHAFGETEFVNIVNAAPALVERSVVLNGVSKAYAMTGWRIGYAGGPAEIIGAMKKVQGQSTSNPAAVSQAAAREALAGDQSKVGEMVKAFKQRHDRVYDLLREIPGVRVKPSMGTFYSFPDFRVAIEKLKGINDDKQLAEFLLKEAGVALVPGSAFGLPGHMRLSYATDMATLEDACGRIRKAIESA